jgi:poly(hydroxyalkanoate) depolymerase family esterase
MKSFAVSMLLVGTILVAKANAKFVLHEPKVPVSGLAPLMVVLHGFSSSAKDVEQVTRFSEWADRKGFYVLYPEAQDPQVWTRSWTYYLPEHQSPHRGESKYIIDYVEEIIKTYAVDPRQVYLAGMSAGASMASILVSCYPDVFKGVAFHSGTSYGLSSTWKEALIDLKAGPAEWRSPNRTCNPGSFQGKIMIFHGTEDRVVNLKHLDRLANDFMGESSIEETIQAPTETRYGYSEITYPNSRAKIFRVDGLIHTWSGGLNDGLNNDKKPGKFGPDATQKIVEFFFGR